MKRQNLFFKVMIGLFFANMSVHCVAMGDVKQVNPGAGQSTWRSTALFGKVTDELTPQLLSQGNVSGGVITISSSGRYQLINNIAGYIDIEASDVELDLHGYMVAYTTAVHDVITIGSSAACAEVHIYGGSVQGRVGASGIKVGAGCSKIMLNSLTVFNCTNGILFSGTVGSLVTESTLEDLTLISNIVGASLTYANANVVKNCSVMYSTQSGFELNNCQANCCFDCSVLKTVGTGTVAGFKSTQGTSNMFQRCVTKQTETSSTTFGDKACGFLLTGTEQKTKIIDCIVNQTDVVSSNTAVTYGINCAPVIQPTADLLSTVTAWTGQGIDPFGIAWSPNNNYLAATFDSNSYLKIYSFDGTNLVNVASLTSPSATQKVAWSPDGKYLAFGGTGGTNLYVYSFNGQTLSLAASFSGGANIGYAVAWSPNGKYIAYCEVPSAPGTGYVRLLSFDGASVSQIGTFTLGSATSLQGVGISWSPDGSALVVGWNALSYVNVIPVTPNGGFGTAVTWSSPSTPYAVKWSPNGRYFAVVDGGNTLTVCRWLPSNVTPIAPVATVGSVIGDIAWSPDGSYIIVQNSSTYAPEIYSFSGSALTLIATASQYATGRFTNTIMWSSDGRYLAAAFSSGSNKFFIYTAMYGPLNCLIDNCRVCDTVASGSNMGRGLVMGGTNVCTRTISCNNGVNYSYGIPNVYDGRFEISRDVAQPFDNVSMPTTL